MKTISIKANESKKITLKKSGEYLVRLLGQGASARVCGVFDVSGSDTVDISLVISHEAKHTRANIVLKGAARDKAQMRLLGRIKIAKDCSDTESFLEERILLLSKQAVAQVLPELEILCDDVKCSHAASVSMIPEETIFYLMSRGIPKPQAEALVVKGFLESVGVE